MLRWMPVLIALGGLALPSAAAAQNANSERVANACAGMGLNPSEAPFAFCEMSLRDDVAAIGHAHRTALEWRACAKKGYHYGTVGFANCVLDREENGAESPPGAPRSAAKTDTLRSYQRGDQTTSVRRACTQIGLAPGSSAYDSCVGNLNMTLDDSNMVGSD
jgi:hypothetical protein